MLPNIGHGFRQSTIEMLPSRNLARDFFKIRAEIHCEAAISKIARFKPDKMERQARGVNGWWGVAYFNEIEQPHFIENSSYTLVPIGDVEHSNPMLLP